MSKIKALRIPKRETSVEDVLATFCYLFPSYTYAEARRLPERRVSTMLKAARREQARQYLELTQIAAAPHSEKGKGVKVLIERYKRDAER
jgi:N-methylhydantoinase A/oxoprolinase/acetone carboxylase beta subunit